MSNIQNERGDVVNFQLPARLIDGEWTFGRNKDWWKLWKQAKTPSAQVDVKRSFMREENFAPYTWKTAYCSGTEPHMEDAMAKAFHAAAMYPKSPAAHGGLLRRSWKRIQGSWRQALLERHYQYKTRSDSETYFPGRPFYGAYWGDDQSALLGIGFDAQELVEFAVHKYAECNNVRDLKIGTLRSFSVNHFLTTEVVLTLFRERRLTAANVVKETGEQYRKTFPYGVIVADLESPHIRGNFRRILSFVKRARSAPMRERVRSETAYSGILEAADAIAHWGTKCVNIFPREGYVDACHPLPVRLIKGKWRYGDLEPIFSDEHVAASIDYANASDRYGTWRWQTSRGVVGEAKTLWQAMDEASRSTAAAQKP